MEIVCRHRRGHPRGPLRHRLARRCATTTASSATHISARRAGLRVLRGQRPPARRFRPAAPAAGLPDLRHQVRARRVRRLADRGAAGAGRPSGAADAAQPRPVQHHDLRAQRPLPRHRGRPAGDLPAPRRHRARSGSTTATSSTSSPTGPTTTSVRCADGFRIVEYDTPRGSAAAYYPETNPLVPLDSTASGSNSPTSKSIIVSLVPAGAGGGDQAVRSGQDRVGADWDHKADPNPRHLS